MSAHDPSGVFLAAGMDTAHHDHIVGLIYAAIMDSQKWVDALQEMRSLFAANFLTLILREASIEDPGLIVWVGDSENGGNARFEPARSDVTPFVNLATDQIYVVDDLMELSEWRRSAYLQHWCTQYDVFHVMSVDISIAGAGRMPLRITRPESAPAFTPQDRARCQALLPHLRRALQMHNLLHRKESLGGAFSSAMGRLSVGTIVLDERGRVFDQNLTAQEILSSGDGLKLAGGGLEAFYPSDNRALQSLIRGAFARHASSQPAVVEALSISRPSGQPALGVVVEVLPAGEWAGVRGRPVAVLYVRDPAGRTLADAEAIRQLFNLTPTETSVALKLADGASLEETAEALGIRRNTARAHLRAIFSKTGVRRQTELVRIMLNSVAPLRGGADV
ncbi:helix-turn-helix transcriptional regulator [Thauera humireducens]|uniref:Helix-turn-helix transcriptional regulator n=1 Tax=Thauera humireducens TaxID=1134435 RepID=A0A127K4Y9_9RHOO|nr:helix-turn-helix transcriptional regulator [Thauera humireducens]AMO37025.1 helix-turn-helix transcriptional regulator [Thauera humireducens]